MITQVLPNRQIQIQGGLLEHHADGGQGGQRVLAYIMAVDDDAALTEGEQLGDQRKQRGLARAVGAQQHGELTDGDAEPDIVQDLTRPIGVT